MANPYDDCDILEIEDDDADESGSFEFVEDEYDSIDYEDDMSGSEPAAYGGEYGVSRTQVRPNYGEPLDDGVLHRGRESGAASNLEPDVEALERGRRIRFEDYVPAYQPEDPAPSRRQKKPRRHKPRRGLRRLVKLLVMVAMLVGLYWLVAHPIDEKLAFSPSEQATLSGVTSWSIPGTPYYALLLGSDAREGEETSRTDTMVLARIDFWGGKVTLVSIPRDTKVEIEGYGTNKINAAYAFGKAGGAAKAVSQLTGVPIHHVAVIHFGELAELIDYVGGVTVTLTEGVYDPDYTGLALEPGAQTLDGETAVLWARSRYGYANGDYQRQENQRTLISALVNRMMSLSPMEFPGLLEVAGGLVGTDLRCYDLIPLLVRFKISHPTIYSCALPTTSAQEDGLWYEVTDDATVQQFMSAVDAGRDPSA